MFGTLENIQNPDPFVFFGSILMSLLMIPTPRNFDIRGLHESNGINGTFWTLHYEYLSNILYSIIIRRLNIVIIAIITILSSFLTINLTMNFDIFGVLIDREDREYTVIGGWEISSCELYIGFARLLYPFFCGYLISRLKLFINIKHSFWICSLLLLLSLCLPRLSSKGIVNGLYESIIILSKSLKKYNIEDSIVNVIDTLHGPIQDEYKKILIDLSYNIPIKEAYLRFYKRTKIKELKNVYHILDINSDNLKEAFDLIRVEFDYLNKKNDITSNVNSVVNVLSSIYLLIPITFIIMVLIVYPDYFDIVNNYPAGYIVIIILALLYVLLFLAIKSIKGDKR